jgi:hypothetical protein
MLSEQQFSPKMRSVVDGVDYRYPQHLYRDGESVGHVSFGHGGFVAVDHAGRSSLHDHPRGAWKAIREALSNR